MIWQRDHMMRRIYLTDKHSVKCKAAILRIYFHQKLAPMPEAAIADF
jgi:hypothetical protein